jgi:ABC-type glycerol-3-phosphate transport system substrate-binding protein
VRTTPRLAAVVTVAALTLTGCGFGNSGGSSRGGDGAAQGGTTTLDLLVPSYSDATKANWEKVISGFQAKNQDVKINLEVQSWDNINDVVRTKVQSNKAPDVLNIDAFSGFARDDLLYKAADVASPNTIGDFQDSFKQNASVGSDMMAFPFIASTRTLFYNKDLLEKAGVSAPPKTWDELLAAAKKVNALGGGVYGYGMPLGNEEAQAETSLWTFGNGGSWTDGSKITVNTPQNLEAVEFMQKMVQEKATQPNPGASDRTPMLNVFIQGKIAMAAGLPPILGQIKQKNPSLNFGTAPIPTKTGEPVTLGVADHLMAFKKDGSKKAAITKFVDYFFSKDVYGTWVDAEGFLPTTKSGAEQLSGKPELKDFLASLPTAKFYPSSNEAWSSTQGALQGLIGQIAQGKSPKSVLDSVQAKADAAS